MHGRRVKFWFCLSLGEPSRQRRLVNRADPRCAICLLVRIQDVAIDVAQEGRVERRSTPSFGQLTRLDVNGLTYEWPTVLFQDG